MKNTIQPKLSQILAERIRQLEIKMSQLENEKAIISKAIVGEGKGTAIGNVLGFKTILPKKVYYY